MSSKILCVLCRKKDPSVLAFNEDSLKKCSEILKIRKKYSLKWMELNLSKNSSGTEGYHLKCYKKLSAIMEKYKVEASEGGSTSASGTSTPAPRGSTTGSETSACTPGE